MSKSDRELAERLIRAYGHKPERWPERDREAVAGALIRYPSLLQFEAEERHLDRALDDYALNADASITALMRRVGKDPVATTVPRGRWLLAALKNALGTHSIGLWRPAAVALLPLALGVALGMFTATGLPEWQLSEQQAFYLGFDGAGAGFTSHLDWMEEVSDVQ